MATKEEKQQLIDTLKFTPRTYKISLWGYGGEKVMGTVDAKVWDYCMTNAVNLQDIAWSDEDTVQDDMGLDLDQLPFTPGQWYECDDMAHTNGVSRNAGHIQIEDENGTTIFEKSLEDCDGADDSPGWSCQDEAWVGMGKKAGDVVFIGSSNEKGTFFEGDIELRAPFDIEKLVLYYDEVDGEELVNCVYYDDEEVENYGGSTDGKSSDMDMVRITNDAGDWERYEPEEKDWGHPKFGPSPSDWESSPQFKFKKHKPVHSGYYRCNFGYGSTYGSLYWNGEFFGDWEYGKFVPKSWDSIVSWQGYNWDTSDWGNQPPEPPNTICDNKKCGWVGHGTELIDDEEGQSHCPVCNSTEYSWIDYDPETKQGRANRSKYCVPATPKDWNPVAELEKIVADFDHLTADKEPWTPVKIKPAEPGVYECQFKKPPAWPWPPTAELNWNGEQWLNDDGDTVRGVKEWRVPQGETV
jgi:hypothetical protein